MGAESSQQTSTVTVNTVEMTPEAAEAFREVFEALGDNGLLVFQPAFQKRLLEIDIAEAVEDYRYAWEDPTELNSNANLPKFPVEDLPPVLRDMIAGVAEEKQIPVDLVAIIALSVLTTSLVGRVNVQVRGNWVEPVTLYSLGIAESGNRKSAAMKALTGPLYETQKQLREALKENQRRLASQQAVAEARVNACKSSLKKDPGSLEYLTMLDEAQQEFDAIEVPELPTLLVNDATPEAMAMALLANGERLGWFDAEGGGLNTASGARYTNGGSNIDLLLKAHIGDPISQRRVGRPELVLNNPIISVGVMSQMQTLRDLVAVPNSSGRGLVDRFLIAAPADYVGYRNLRPEQLSETVKHAYARLLASYVSGLWNAEGSYTLTLSEDASTVLGLFDHEVEVRLRAQGDLRHLGGFGNKLVGQSTRYAAIHHLAAYGITGAFSHPIGADSMGWGIAVAEWSVEHYRYAVAAAGETGDLSDAERVLRWLKNRSDKTATVTQRHVYKTCNLGTKDRAQAALELLRDHNWVREARERKVAGQGRPPTVWQVHPSLVDEG